MLLSKLQDYFNVKFFFFLLCRKNPQTNDSDPESKRLLHQFISLSDSYIEDIKSCNYKKLNQWFLCELSYKQLCILRKMAYMPQSAAVHEVFHDVTVEL